MYLKYIVDFLIIALCVFLMIRAINKLSNLKKKEEVKKEEKPAKSDEVVLLEEIRNILKKSTK